MICVETEEEDEERETADDAQLAAMLHAMPHEQRARLAVLSQVAPILQQAVDVLRHPQATAAERARHAGRSESAAGQVDEIAAKQPEVPWTETGPPRCELWPHGCATCPLICQRCPHRMIRLWARCYRMKNNPSPVAARHPSPVATGEGPGVRA